MGKMSRSAPQMTVKAFRLSGRHCRHLAAEAERLDCSETEVVRRLIEKAVEAKEGEDRAVDRLIARVKEKAPNLPVRDPEPPARPVTPRSPKSASRARRAPSVPKYNTRHTRATSSRKAA